MHQHIPCRRIIWHIVSHNHQYNTDGFRYVKRDYSIHDFRISLLNHLAQDLVLHRTISVPDKYLSLAVIYSLLINAHFSDTYIFVHYRRKPYPPIQQFLGQRRIHGANLLCLLTLPYGHKVGVREYSPSTFSSISLPARCRETHRQTDQ